MSLYTYILTEGDEPLDVPLMEWAEWIENDARRGIGNSRRVVQHTDFDTCFVSTVFLGLDHAFTLEPHEPILWETMVFWYNPKTYDIGGREYHRDYEGNEQERYTSRQDALDGHARWVSRVETGEIQAPVFDQISTIAADGG